MKKIKILHVIGSLRIGGAENIAVNFWRYLDKNKFVCDYLVFGDEIGDYEKEVEELGGQVIHIEHPNKNYFNYIKNMKTLIKDNKYDVIHSHLFLNNGLTLKIAKAVNVKIRISHSHSTNTGIVSGFKYNIYEFLMKKMIKKYSTEFMACGIDAGNYLYGDKFFMEKGIVINNAIDTEKYRYNKNVREITRDKLNIKDEFIIGHVGRLVDVKNHKFLLEIFKEIKIKYKNAKLLIVGDGELRLTIEKKIKELDIEDSVIITGNCSEVDNMMQVMDVLVFPSLYEGLPVTLIEAQSAGLPCIISKNITEEVRVTNLVQFISLEESAEFWAEKVLEFNNKKKNRNNIQLDKIKESGFDINKMIKKLEVKYEA